MVLELETLRSGTLQSNY